MIDGKRERDTHKGCRYWFSDIIYVIRKRKFSETHDGIGKGCALTNPVMHLLEK